MCSLIALAVAKTTFLQMWHFNDFTHFWVFLRPTDSNCNFPHLDGAVSSFTSGPAGTGFSLGGNTGADLKLYSLGWGGSGSGSGVGSLLFNGLPPNLKLYGLGSGPNGYCGEGGGTGTFASAYLAFLRL